MRLPRLPVSRRRHEAELRGHAWLVKWQRDEARSERDEWAARGESAVARVAELEQAIREHHDTLAKPADRYSDGLWDTDRELWSVLDGHDRQERTGSTPVCHVAEHAEAERIVADMAKPNPGFSPLAYRVLGGHADEVECRYCERRWMLGDRHALSLHDTNCVWRRAVEHTRPYERHDEPVTYQDGVRHRLGELPGPAEGGRR